MCLQTTLTNDKTLALITQGYKVLAEYRLIEQLHLKGIYVIPSYSSILLWFGVVFIHSGLYSNSVFRFSIILPDNFPDGPSLPSVIFQYDIFHPHICPVSHSLDLSPFFNEWNKKEHNISDILKTIQLIFADPEGSVLMEGMYPLTEVHNKEALNLLIHNRVDYAVRVKRSTTYSINNLFDKPLINDPHYIVFEPYVANKHQTAMEQLKSDSWYELAGRSSRPSVCVARLNSEQELLQEENIRAADWILNSILIQFTIRPNNIGNMLFPNFLVGMNWQIKSSSIM